MPKWSAASSESSAGSDNFPSIENEKSGRRTRAQACSLGRGPCFRSLPLRFPHAQNVCEQTLLRVVFETFRWQAASSRTGRALSENIMNPIADSVRRVANADGGIVLNLRRGTMFQVNPLGARILDLLERQDSPNQIAVRISAEFAVPLDVVETDVVEFLDALATEGVLDPRWSRE